MKIIFVFGSNEGGRHGKGAALYAVQHHGAAYGQGFGLQGSSFGIPTKSAQLDVLPIPKISKYFGEFISIATELKDTHLFLLTPIGCGLAGYTRIDMLTMMKSFVIPENVVFTREWFQK